MSDQAQAAKMIRTILKEKFPTVKFSVTSQGFAGGDSVDVRYQNGPPTEQVKKEISHFQYGHFNGMEDIYEYSNKKTDLPQTKYLMVQREISEANRKMVTDKIVKDYGMIGWNDMECRAKCGVWTDQKFWMVAQDMTFAS